MIFTVGQRVRFVLPQWGNEAHWTPRNGWLGTVASVDNPRIYVVWDNCSVKYRLVYSESVLVPEDIPPIEDFL